MDYRVEMFEKFDLTESERKFIENVDASGGQNIMKSAEIHTILTNFYHAKQLEKSAESSDRSARTMTRLTWALVAFTAVQAVAAALMYLNAN